MAWIWQLKQWPNFQYDSAKIQGYEQEFLKQTGKLTGLSQHINAENLLQFKIELLCDESINTSEIEGETLNRDSLRSSIRKHLGLGKERTKTRPNEEGISEMMVQIHQEFKKTLSEEMLCDWNSMLMMSRWDLNTVGHYRVHDEPMQIVSGNYSKPIVHYEAPASKQIPTEMKKCIDWYAQSQLPALTKAAIAHLYFLCIHPFEDGNGRIARGLSIKSLSESIDEPSLISLSEIINSDKKSYYAALAKTNHSLEITDWLIYFSETVLAAQRYTMKIIDFTIAKSKFFIQFQAQLNDRQAKVIARIFREGIKGFEGGLSAKNYVKIADTTASTATRDLQELVAMGALVKSGELKSTRYFLSL